MEGHAGRRASFAQRLSVRVLEDLNDALAAAAGARDERTVAPADLFSPPRPSSSLPVTAEASGEDTKNSDASSSIDLPMSKTKMSLARHAFVTAGEGVAGAAVSALVLVPVLLFLNFISTEFRVDLQFLFLLMTTFCCEIECMLLFGRTSPAYRNRTLLAKWPAFFVSAILVVLATRDDEEAGLAAFPLSMLCWTVALVFSGLYTRRFQGRTDDAVLLLSSVVTVIALTGITAVPSFAVLIPVKYLSSRHPTWNIVVGGLLFPAFIVVLRKIFMSWVMSQLQVSVRDREMAPDKVLSTFATISKMVAFSLMLANVVIMYLSKTISGCLISALLSIVTEVGCKIYIVWTTRAAMRGDRLLQQAAAGLQQVVVEPGIRQGGTAFGGDVEEEVAETAAYWKMRALAAEKKIKVLEELLIKTREKYGEEGLEVEELLAENHVVEGADVLSSMEGKDAHEKIDGDQDKKWEFVMGMLSARWEKEMVAEKSCILFSAFLIYLFDLSVMPTEDLVLVCAIFFSSEFVTDLVLVSVLDRVFNMPILSLPHAKWADICVENIIFTHESMGVAFCLFVVNKIVNQHIKA